MVETSYDWKIHKILDETKRVYICSARGNSKPYTQLELYSELMAQNKEIVLVRSSDIPRLSFKGDLKGV